MPASLAAVAQQLPAPTAETLAELAAVQPLTQTWLAWCSTTSATVMVNDTAWTTWNYNITSTTGSLACSITPGAAYAYNGAQWVSWNAGHQETEDQRAAREERERQVQADWQRRHEEQEREREERARERQAAQERSLEVLRSLLSGEQWASYQEKGWFEVRGRSGRRWRVRSNGQSGNIDLMPEIGEERDATYCAHPQGWLPDADAHAAQMLALVTDDEAFLRVANRQWRRREAGDEPAFTRPLAA